MEVTGGLLGGSWGLDNSANTRDNLGYYMVCRG